MKRTALTQLNQWKQQETRKPLILKGARQVGKTYILQEFGSQEFAQYHYINFEQSPDAAAMFEFNLDPQRIIQELSFYLDRSIDIHNDLIIFDEIQEAPKALTSLKYFCEQYPRMFICAAGSLLGLQLSQASFPVGKVDFLPLYPLSFEEFLMALNDQKSLDILTHLTTSSKIPQIIHEHLWQQFKYYLYIGGLPEAITSYLSHQEDTHTAFQNVRTTHNNLILAYEADIAKHSGAQNAMHIARLWRNIPSQLASTSDGAAPKFKFKGILPKVSRYSQLAGCIDWLKSTGMLIQTPIVNQGQLPLNAYTKDNMFKLYMFDVGILGALNQISPQTILNYDYGTYKGYYAENFVIQEFSAHNHRSFCWREGTSEVEFLIEHEGHVIPYEVKSGSVTHAKSLSLFKHKYQPPYQVILSAKPFSVHTSPASQKIPLYLAGFLPFKSS